MGMNNQRWLLRTTSKANPRVQPHQEQIADQHAEDQSTEQIATELITTRKQDHLQFLKSEYS